MAAKGKVTVSIDHAAVLRVVGPQVDQAAYRAAQKTRSRVVQNINALGRNNTGQMKNSVRVRRDESSQDMVKAYTVGSTVTYAAFQEFGTHGHGPRRRKFLAFQVRGRGPMIFARFVKGVVPGRFMQNALKALRPSDYMP